MLFRSKKNIPHTYLWYALKFSILIYPLHYNWYYSHFIDPVIYGYKGQNKYKIDYYEYFDEINIFSEVLEIDLYTDRNCIRSNVEKFFRDCLKEGKYIEIELDFFYITGYADRHYTHPLLVYGYEDDTYFVLGFNSNGIFTTFNLQSNEFVQAYYSAVKINYTEENMIDKYSYHILKRKTKVKKYDKHNFINQLREYYVGSHIVDTYKKFPDGMNTEAKIITGRMAIINLLSSAINVSTLAIDYRAFHFLAEHKIKLLEAIKFWSKDLNIKSNLVEGFESIAKQYEHMRLWVLKSMVKNQHKSENIFINEQFLSDCLVNVEKMVIEESRLLENIL